MTKQTINIHCAGAVQIGGHCTQVNAAAIQALVQQIESSEAPPEDKEEVKNLLNKVLTHPLVADLVGKAVGLG